MKVKFIEGYFLKDLEERINDFLANENYDVVDIKYQDGSNGYSVLIICYDLD